MDKKIFTVAIIGVGARGANAYGWQLNDATDRFNIVSLCDIRPERLEIFGEKFNVPKEARFTDENEFFKEKRADLILIATQDKDHVRHCLKAFELGYEVMTEKPLTDKREDCEALLAAQKKAGTHALVCHVLRYAPAFLRANEILKSGELGQLVAINALERVAFLHQAHSYVRGNWRSTDEPCGSAPMILAKCCHDLDLLQWYANSTCKSISSVGDLVYFKKENEPEYATDYCLDCKEREACPYSAWRAYVDAWHWQNCPTDIWPYNVLTTPPVTEEKLLKALDKAPYGRCVYRCDNNVVDHQLTTMTFDNGVKATLTMTAFTRDGGRRIHFHCTLGELILEEANNTLTVSRFGSPTIETIDLADLNEKGYGHGGGDEGLINALYDMLTDNSAQTTSFAASVESHLMGICAEESRLKGGELVFVHK